MTKIDRHRSVRLPSQLEEDCQDLVEDGEFSSLSSLIRYSLRNTVQRHKYVDNADNGGDE